MKTTNDGGLAFPRPESRGTSGATTLHGQDGMTLRDYLAGQALAGIMAGNYTSNSSGWVPGEAYALADAMLRARKKAST